MTKPAIRTGLAIAICFALLALGWLVWSTRVRPSALEVAENAVTDARAPSPTPTEPDAERPTDAGEAPARASAAPPAAETESVVPSSVRTVVFGALLDEHGERIRGAWSEWVSLVDADGRRRVADAKETGAYALSDLPFGSYVVTAGAHGFREASDRIDITPSEPVVQRDFVLHRSVVLRVKASTPEGGSLLTALQEAKSSRLAMELLAVATAGPPGSRLSEITGSKNGRFGVGHFWNYGPNVEQLPRGYLGVLVLVVEPPVYANLLLYQQVIDSRRVEPGVEEVEFVVSVDSLLAKLATLRMRVIDSENGAALEGVRAELWGPSAPDLQGAQTDSEGALVIADRPAGHFVLMLEKPGYEHLRSEVDFAPGVTNDLGDLALSPAIVLKGRVVDGEGRPVSAELALGTVDPATGAVRFERETRRKAAEDGSFEFQGLGRRLYVLRTGNLDALNDSQSGDVAWVSGNVTVDLRGGPAPGVELRLVRAVPLVLSVANEPANGLRFRISDAERRTLLEGRFYDTTPRPLRLPPGRWRVELLDTEGRVLSEQDVELVDQRVRLALSR